MSEIAGKLEAVGFIFRERSEEGTPSRHGVSAFHASQT
jgi:hypothetical protein